jgi:ABC-2 type transporter
MTTAATAAPPGRTVPVPVSIATITGRNLRRLVRVPTLLVFATVQPVLFVLLFTYAFGGAIHVPGVARYIDYLLPGIVVLAIGFGASQTGVAIAEDLTTGMIDRFRSLPINAAAVLAGRVAADALRNLFVTRLMIGVAAAIGPKARASACYTHASTCHIPGGNLVNAALTSVAMAALVADGILAGLSLDKVIVQLPARRRIGVAAYAAYARAADLGNGIAFYATVGWAPRC